MFRAFSASHLAMPESTPYCTTARIYFHETVHTTLTRGWRLCYARHKSYLLLSKEEKSTRYQKMFHLSERLTPNVDADVARTSVCF